MKNTGLLYIESIHGIFIYPRRPKHIKQRRATKSSRLGIKRRTVCYSRLAEIIIILIRKPNGVARDIEAAAAGHKSRKCAVGVGCSAVVDFTAKRQLLTATDIDLRQLIVQIDTVGILRETELVGRLGNRIDVDGVRHNAVGRTAQHKSA